MLAFLSNHYATKFHTEKSESPPACNDNNEYTIVNRAEIGKKLNLLFKNQTLLSIKVPGKFADSTLLTTITYADDLHIFLGGFQNELFNKDLLQQNTLTVTADFEGIAVSFVLNKFSGQRLDGEFNLKSPHPESLEWVQRRNARRVKIPINIPVKIQHNSHPALFDVADISVIGLSYIDQTKNHCFSSIGGLHTDCTLILPDQSTHAASLEVVNNINIPLRHAEQLCRVGCELKRPSYRLDTALQHLINQIDFFHQG